MSEGKTYVFGNEGNSSGWASLIAPLLQQRGVDPNVAMAMLNNRDGFGGDGGWFIWVIFLFFLMGWGNNGWGGNRNGNGSNSTNTDAASLASLINNDNGRELLMQAIQGNAAAVSQLSSTLNCSIGQIQQAINATTSQIQAGNAQLSQQLATCCCDNQLAISQQTNTLQQAINAVATSQERGFAQIGYDTAMQTCQVKDAIRESTAQIVAGQRAAEMRELTRDLAEKDRRIAEQAVVINNSQQTNIFSQMLQQATAPLMSAVTSLQSEIDSLKYKFHGNL